MHAKNILVLGGGGREHAIVKAIKNSKNITHISCAPGNPGIAKDASCHLTDPTDMRSVLDLVKRIKPDLVVVGPEAPLAAGIVDTLKRFDVRVFGPGQRSAQLESSKVFAKNFMGRHNLPTAKFVICTNLEEMMRAREHFPDVCVVKADGLASGKGVYICKTAEDYTQAAKDLFENKILGKASEKVLIEEFIQGEEMSVLALIADGKFELLPIAQDYKRLQDGDLGPNTGGMGSYAPVKVNAKSLSAIVEKVIEPTLKGMVEEKLDYRGVLYFGLMIKDGEPVILEYNVRFGDPEAQVILPLLNGDWAEVFTQISEGKVPKLKWTTDSAVCVVIASPGYPENPKKGLRILLDREIIKSIGPDLYFLHAGTASHNGYITSGGRVLNVVSVGKKMNQARQKAYELVPGAIIEGMLTRSDIALGIGGVNLPPKIRAPSTEKHHKGSGKFSFAKKAPKKVEVEVKKAPAKIKSTKPAKTKTTSAKKKTKKK